MFFLSEFWTFKNLFRCRCLQHVTVSEQIIFCGWFFALLILGQIGIKVLIIFEIYYVRPLCVSYLYDNILADKI